MSEQIAEEKIEAPGRTRRRIRDESEREAFLLMEELGTKGQFQVEVHRTSPTSWGSPPEPCDGLIGTYNEPFTLQALSDLFGGGAYDLKFFTPGDDGRMKLLQTCKVKIGGRPRGEPNAVAVVPTAVKPDGPGEQAVRDAMRMSQQMVQQAVDDRRRLEESRDNRGTDPSVQMAFDALKVQQQQAADKDRELMRLIATKPVHQEGNPILERMLDKMVDGESARILALRAQHESEIRTMSERHRADIDRIEARHDDALRRIEDGHKRELDAMVRGHEQQSIVTTTANMSLIEGYKREIVHLDRQLTASQTELAELRARKDKSVIETLTEAAAMKEAMEAFGGGEKEEGGTVERIISGLANSPIAEAVASRFQQGPAPVAPMGVAPGQGQELPINQPVQIRMPDGTTKTVVRRPDGRVRELRRKADGPQSPGDAPPMDLDPGQVAQAVAYMEGAIRNNTDPEIFASSARSAVSPSILAQLRARGVDDFLQNVARLGSDSPLHTINGKNWARKVAAILISDE